MICVHMDIHFIEEFLTMSLNAAIVCMQLTCITTAFQWKKSTVLHGSDTTAHIQTDRAEFAMALIDRETSSDDKAVIQY